MFAGMAVESFAMSEQPDLRRRRLVAGLVTAGAGSLVLPAVRSTAVGQDALSPTPACDDGDEPTPRQTAGPFYTPRSPERSMLREAGMAGTLIVLVGVVLTRSCRPVPDALVDLWHADNSGRYDNDGFRLRGHQFTDAEGRYAFETIVPGLYPARTRHFHVKYQAPNRRILTTQLYFPGEPRNNRDGIFRPELLMRVNSGVASFETVLDLP
jgi:protocatechuate 3,4-dioxygenase beta subunit